MNNILDRDETGCTSCQVCSAVCPCRAIRFTLDSFGFYRPIVDEQTCISCGICRQNCAKFTVPQLKDIHSAEVFAAVHKDSAVLFDSSSGGVATAFYTYAIRQGYRCFGVTYNSETHRAEGYIFNDEKDIPKVRHSKYIPVYAEDALRKIYESDEKWLIIAAPCMLYGIKKALESRKKNSENYIYVDFFCHGVPSQLVWNKQLEDIQKKYHTVAAVNFRSKNACWHAYLLSILSEGKQICIPHAPFYDLFFSDYLLNSACAECVLRDITDVPDIRIGDFWGRKYDTATDGVSAAVCFSQKGKQLLNAVSEMLVIRQETSSELLPYQAVGKKYRVNAQVRAAMFDALSKQNGLKKALHVYIAALPVQKRMLFQIKRMVKRIVPARLQSRIRKLVHS